MRRINWSTRGPCTSYNVDWLSTIREIVASSALDIARCHPSLVSASGHQERLYRVRCSENLGLLYGEHRVNALRADDAAFTNKGTLPCALHLVDNRESYFFPLVSGVFDVPICEGCCGWSEEFLVEPVDRAGCIAEHAVDAG